MTLVSCRVVAAQGSCFTREHILSPIMEREVYKVDSVMEDGLGRDLINAGRFCFSCEQIFANRKCLEEHVCPATTFICSCGTEFAEYKDMQEHSTTHEPGHQVLDHETIRKRRLEKRKAEEEQLKRIETGEVIWQAPKLGNVASVASPLKPVPQPPILPQVSGQSVKISQVPELHPSLSQACFQPIPASSNAEVKNIFASVGAPTVDLWTLYQPVVLLQTSHGHVKARPYACGRCGQRFTTKPALIAHHNTHVMDKVSGCIACGLLLSSKKLVPRFHVCNSPNNITKLKIITAKPLRAHQFDLSRSLNLNSGHMQAIPALESKSLNLIPASKGSEVTHVTPARHFKNQNVRAHRQNNQRLHVSPSLQPKSSNPRVFSAVGTVPFSAKIQSPNVGVSNKSSGGRPVTISGQLKVPINSVSGVPNNQTKTSPVSKGFTCRVCHIPFETTTLLQRHKCIKAKEFMAQHGRPGKPQYRINSVTPAAGPNLTQMNGERMFGLPTSGNIKKNQVMAVGLNQGHGALPVHRKTEVDMEDDCYIVEPDKPAEMIYQVTSSVPIKT